MGHFYERDGTPKYQVPTKDGKWHRDATIRDARKLGLVPSVTEVLGIIAKPGLVNWRVKQGILAALTLPRQEGWSEEDYLAQIKKDGQQQANDAADKGTAIHNQLEMDRVGAFPVQDEWKPTCERVRELLNETFPKVGDWVAEEPFAHEIGFGGRVDLHSKSGVTVDYKSTDKPVDGSVKLAYEQHYQLAAYQQGMHLPFNRCANIFIHRETGEACIHVWGEHEIKRGWKVFQATLALWKLLKKYDSSF